MEQLTQQLVNGIMLGCLYALIAVGYTMVYGIIELINFAFSELFMFGAFICIALTSTEISLFGSLVGMPQISFFLAVIVSMLVVGLLGVVMERLAYRPLRNAPRLAALISAIGMSIFLQNLAQSIFGSQQIKFPDIPVFTTSAGMAKAITVLGAQVTYLQLFVVVVTVAAMVLLSLFVNRTRLGRAMRASAQDKRTAALMGVNVNGIIAVTFFIGSAMGALAGGLYGAVCHFARPDMGFVPGLKAFIAAVLGGIGNIPGAFLGGLTLGMVESLGAAYIPGGSKYRDAIAFVILILILTFKPTGLLGSPVSEKA